jgi:hypothetical protein
VRWIYVVYGVSSATQANAYIESNGATFGWSTTDGDNTQGANAILFSGMCSYMPWIGAIRTSDMKITHAEDIWTHLDIRNVAVELASE